MEAAGVGGVQVDRIIMTEEQVKLVLNDVEAAMDNAGIKVFRSTDHKFEGWLHVQLVEALLRLGVVQGGIRVEERVDDDQGRFPDISWGKAPDRIVVEVKLIADRSVSQDLGSIDDEIKRMKKLSGVRECWLVYAQIPEKLRSDYYERRLKEIVADRHVIRSVKDQLVACKVK